MLLSIHVKNLAVIDEVEVDFTEHLNILTGETGAGKSILIGSVNLALGTKASAGLIRKGADYALVELVFRLEDQVVEEKLKKLDLSVEDGLVILSRKIMKTRSICKINGENVTAAILKEIAGLLIDIHGQHEHQSLLYKDKHLEIVDRFAKEEIEGLKEELLLAYEQYMAIKKKRKECEISKEERMREISFLQYEKEEIEGAHLKEGEDEELEACYRRLSNANTIVEEMGSVHQITSESGEGIGRALRTLGRLTEYDQAIGSFHNQLLELDDLLSDFNREAADYLSGFGDYGEEFAKVEERLNLVHGLKAKYGAGIPEIIKHLTEIEEKLEAYENHEAYVEELNKELSIWEQKVEKLSGKLSVIRKKKAGELEVKITNALTDLNFLEVHFSISINRISHYSANGYDEAEFLIATNPGEDPKPLGKVASGGELSRIMLAVKSVLAENDAIDTLIFDEIDVGVSGRTAQKVSEKLALISNSHQVICITHLPQIAAMADTHFLIEKTAEEGMAKTNIRCLDKEESIQELARILGGAKITKAVVQNAKEMKELAEHTKIYSF